MYEQWFKDTQLSTQLTLLELPSLLTMLAWAEEEMLAEDVVDLASQVERLLAEMGRPQALAVVTRVREGAARALGEWSHARFLAESANIDRLRERGDRPADRPLLDSPFEVVLRAR